MRPRCSVFIATSLDGFIARRDGALDWLGPFQTNGEDYGYARFADSIDTLVIGRKTYEVVLGFGAAAWPYAGKRVIVLTHRTLEPKHGEESYAGDVSALVERLTRGGARRIYVDGGAIVRQFVAAGLVDDLTISIVPVLLGEGIPLFGKTDADIGLRLVDSRAFPSGLVQLEYRPREPGEVGPLSIRS
jgi:dihydrofolate reductase